MEDPPEIKPDIFFMISVPDGRPEEATPFQGFALSLCENAWLLNFIQRMPSNVFELTPDFIPYRVGRRIAGVAPIRWFGQSPKALKSQLIPREMAFSVVFLDQQESFADYADWVAACPAPVTVVAVDGGHIRYTDLSFDAIRNRFLTICELINQRGELRGVERAKNAILSWTNKSIGTLSYELRGHGTITPNIAALRAAGYEIPDLQPFNRFFEEQAYVEQISRSANTIFDIRSSNGPSAANRIYPRSLDLNIYCPTTYNLESALKPRAELSRNERKQYLTAIRMLQKQSGYSFTTSSPNEMKILIGGDPEETQSRPRLQPHPVILMRQREISLGTEVVACLAASEISAVVRLPNRINKTSGAVRQFAQHYRADRPRSLKRVELFRSVQRALGDAFPADFYSILNRSRDGIRIISDAHIEWLDVRGIPLGLRYNVARIPVTPGNAFIATTVSLPPIFAEPEDFLDVLVVSGLPESDPIAQPFKVAFKEFGKYWQDRLRLTNVRVTTKEQLIAAMNSFQGMIMVFDGHGSHTSDDAGVIWLDTTSVDVWSLRGEVHRAPPIVILSACDTHAADRNHATVANGFLALGSRSVLGSVFPLHAAHAAIFAARLLYRVADYIPAAIKMLGRSITWLEVVSGMLRRQLVTDILRQLESAGLIENSEQIHKQASYIVDLPRDDPISDVREFLLGKGLQPPQLDEEIYKAVANSSTISYVHLGRPETIIINSKATVRKIMIEDDAS